MAAAPPTTTGHGGFVYLDAAALHSVIPHSALISHLRSSLPSISGSVVSPSRQGFPLDSSTSSSFLLMPAWSQHSSLPYIGLKAVTSFPRNSSLPAPLPGVHAAYLLFSSATGAPLAALDGTALTLLRTSAASALAAAHLTRPSPRVLVLAGTGSLGPHLISAHRTAHPTIRRVIIWNRTPVKARDLALKLQEEVKLGMKDTDEGKFSGKLQEQAEMNGAEVAFEYAENLDDVVGLGDIVSCATGSERPIVKGKLLKPGAHLDLVGSFTPLMRECDDDALLRGRVFVDFEVALEEAGELVGAFQRGIMEPTDVVGTLVELVSGAKVGRRSDEEVTVYKSVGTAVVDILAAQLAYENYLRGSLLLWSLICVHYMILFC